MARFLGDRRDEKAWTVAREARGVYWVGEGPNALEVVYVEFPVEPTRAQVSALWRERQAKRAAPVLLVAAWPEVAPSRAWLCGPIGEDPPMVVRELGQAERLAAQALAEPTRTFAIQYLNGALVEVDDPLPGVRNDGLLATHELREGVRRRNDWKPACERSRTLVNLRDRALVEALGYRIDQRGDHAVLRAADGDEIRAVAVFLDRGERPDRPSARFDQRTPVTHALTLADREGLRWVVAVRGSTLRLYSTATSGAAGQRGRTETFVELDLPLLADEHAGYLTLLFAADALGAGGTFDEIAAASRDFTTGLSERMRERIYDRTIPDLALAIARRYDGPLDKAALDAIYHAAMTVLFRLLFVAYAEDQRLLPYAASEDYRANSLKALAQRFAHRINAGEPLGFRDPFRTADAVADGDGTDELWSRCRALFQAVDQGNAGWDIPAYNGGLFSEASPEGQRIAALSLTNAEFGPALAALVLDRTPDGGVGPIDFRSLSVREFGSIYEGLLESELAVAEQDLTLKNDSTVKAEVYVPAGDGDRVVVVSGGVYLHNASGARKATGSYFTPPFAVDHLIDSALRPTLAEHLERVEALLDAGDDAAAAQLLLNFRVADISMGSGHFLTAAIDAIEAMVTDFLARRPISQAAAELARLHQAAVDALGEAADRYDIEGSQLLRRLIARRCIYGLDLNPIAVELTRVSVWIHTFVPGLPLSFLDHNLTVGNSLTGVGTVEEAEEGLAPSSSQRSFFYDPIRDVIAAASEPLERLGLLNDATPLQVEQARRAAAEIDDAVEPVRRLFDLVTAYRMGMIPQPSITDIGDVDDLLTSAVRESVRAMVPAHFPAMFPEVFIGDGAGFDVIVGNPPYKEPVVEELAFFARHRPGLNALRTDERNAEIARLRRERPDLVSELKQEQKDLEQLRAALHSGPYPGMSDGDPDLYKAFCWRFLHLTRSGGSLGLVLPRSVFATKGSSPWRNAFLPESDSFVTTVRNTREWVFADVNPGYTFVFLAVRNLRKGKPELRVAGRYASEEHYRSGLQREPVFLSINALQGRDDTLALPDLRSDGEAALFADLLLLPTLGEEHRSDFLVRPNTDFHASNDRKTTKILKDDGDWPVYNHRNVGHFRFEPSEGVFTSADFATAIAELRRRKLKGARNSKSAFSTVFEHRGIEWIQDDSGLPALMPRIIFRDVIHASNPRKVWAAVAPTKTLLTNKAPYLLFARGGVEDQAFLLAMMNSSVCDWYGHLFISLNLNYFILNTLPIPQFVPGDPRCRRALELAAFLATDGAEGEFGGWTELAATDHPDRDCAVAEIDGLASLLYGLTDDQLPLVWDDSRQDLARPALARVQEHRRNWSA